MASTTTVTPFQAEHFLEDKDRQTKTSSSARIRIYPPAEPTVEQRMKLIDSSGTLDFWNRPEEDGYTENDGEPI